MQSRIVSRNPWTLVSLLTKAKRFEPTIVPSGWVDVWYYVETFLCSKRRCRVYPFLASRNDLTRCTLRQDKLHTSTHAPMPPCPPSIQSFIHTYIHSFIQDGPGSIFVVTVPFAPQQPGMTLSQPVRSIHTKPPASVQRSIGGNLYSAPAQHDH